MCVCAQVFPVAASRPLFAVICLKAKLFENHCVRGLYKLSIAAAPNVANKLYNHKYEVRLNSVRCRCELHTCVLYSSCVVQFTSRDVDYDAPQLILLLTGQR